MTETVELKAFVNVMIDPIKDLSARLLNLLKPVDSSSRQN